MKNYILLIAVTAITLVVITSGCTSTPDYTKDLRTVEASIIHSDMDIRTGEPGNTLEVSDLVHNEGQETFSKVVVVFDLFDKNGDKITATPQVVIANLRPSETRTVNYTYYNDNVPEGVASAVTRVINATVT